MTIPLSIQVASAKRQLAFLKRESPKWVERGTWTQARADEEIAAMDAVLATVQRAEFLAAISDEMKGQTTQQVELIEAKLSP